MKKLPKRYDEMVGVRMIRSDTKKDYELYNSKIEENAKLEQENEKLKDNWNKLKKWLYEEHYLYVPEIASNSTYQVVLNKMQELEKGCD